MDRDEFVRSMISALSSRQQDSAEWKGKPRTAEEVFQQLTFDMPNVSHKDLEMLTSAVRTLALGGDDRQSHGPMQWFSVHPMVVENVLHLASQHEKSDSTEGSMQPLQTIASQLCAALLVEVPLHLLQSDKATCIHVLGGYLVPREPLLPDQSSAELDGRVAEEHKLTDLTDHKGDEGDAGGDGHAYAAEEDPDDFVFEGSVAPALPPACKFDDAQSRAVPEDRNIDYSWEALEDALLQLWRQLSYGCLSAIDLSTWEATSLTSTLCQVIRLLRRSDESPADKLFSQLENKVQIWSTCAFILRERMLHYPQTIPTVLEALLRVLDSRLLQASTGRRARQIAVEDMVSTAVIGSLCHVVQQSQHVRHREFLRSFVLQRLDTIVETIEQLLKEDLVSAVDILCNCIALVADVDFETCKILKPAAPGEFDQLLTSRAIAVAVTAFVSSIETATGAMDGALVAALKKLEMVITGLTLLSAAVASFVAHFPTYIRLFVKPGTLHERVVVYIINPLVRMRVCLGIVMNTVTLPQAVATDTEAMLRDTIPIALNFDHAFARAALAEDTSKTLQMLSGLAPGLVNIKATHPETGLLLHEHLVALLQRLRAWTDTTNDEAESHESTVKTTCYLSSATQAICIASLKRAVSRLQGESGNKVD